MKYTKKYFFILNLFFSLLLIFCFPSGVLAQELPNIQSEYMYLFDLISNQVLYEKGGNERIFPASMTKMMTEIIAIESLPDMYQTIEITDQMLAGLLEANAAVAGFAVGDRPTIEDLLYAAALPSGADAVNALVYTVSATTDAFVEKMNQKALEIGMLNTHFENATGLHHDNHYSTCEDISTLLKYCLQNETFRQIVSTRSYISTPLASQQSGIYMQSTVWKNVNEGPDSILIPGFAGGKTGYTTKAGYCLASSADINGMHLILVTAKNPAEGGNLRDASKIYSWMEETFEQKIVLSKDTVIQTIKIQDTFPFKSIEVKNENDISLPVKKGEDIKITTTINGVIDSPIQENELLGKIQVSAGEEIIYEKNVVAIEAINRNTLFYFGRITLAAVKEHTLLSIFFLLITLFLLLVLRRHLIIARRRRLRRKRRKQKRRTIL